jgi:hypothetical protein
MPAGVAAEALPRPRPGDDRKLSSKNENVTPTPMDKNRDQDSNSGPAIHLAISDRSRPSSRIRKRADRKLHIAKDSGVQVLGTSPYPDCLNRIDSSPIPPCQRDRGRFLSNLQETTLDPHAAAWGTCHDESLALGDVSMLIGLESLAALSVSRPLGVRVRAVTPRGDKTPLGPHLHG